MKSVSSLAIIAVLLFACKLCSLTSNHHPEASSPTPTPTPRPMLYAGDLIRQQLGQFVLVKHYTREEMRKAASGFGITLLGKSNDAGIGDYRSENAKTVVLSVYSFPTKETAESLIDQLETDMRSSRKWTLVSNERLEHGKRLEALGVWNGKSSGMVIWNNGQWLFMTLGDGLSEARLLAGAVGY
jgi:hypothetical protein